MPTTHQADRRTPAALMLLCAALIAVGACASDDGDDAVPTSATDGASVTHGDDHPPGTTGAPGTSSAATPGPPEGVVEFGPFDQAHTDGTVAYGQTPPVGGAHAGPWQTCGFYEVAIPSERGVHSLEHGAVWITFAPDLPGDQRQAIEALADGQREVLASPFEGLPGPVVASAWGLQLTLESAIDPRLAEFVDFYENGPQTPELDTPCAGGTTETA